MGGDDSVRRTAAYMRRELIAYRTPTIPQEHQASALELQHQQDPSAALPLLGRAEDTCPPIWRRAPPPTLGKWGMQVRVLAVCLAGC